MWGSSTPSGANNSLTASQELRKKQISSLKSSIPSVRELARDSTYETVLQLTSFSLHLSIYLPDLFPAIPPRVTVKPSCQHPWINPNTGEVTGHIKLTSSGWSRHSSLGKLVLEIITEFKERNPVKLTTPSSPKQHHYHSSLSSSLSFSSSNYSQRTVPLPSQLSASHRYISFIFFTCV